jgi:hypothetical protein
VFAEFEFTQEDWEMFAEYGRTMLSLQEFEFMLLAALGFEIPDVVGLTKEESNEFWSKMMAKFFRQTAGQVKARLAQESDMPEELLGDVTAIVRLRNFLAHTYLRDYMFRRMSPRAEELTSSLRSDIDLFRNIREGIEDVNTQLLEWGRSTHGGGS